MKTLAEVKQKHNNLEEFIVSLDKEGKIIFLEYEDFCSKQKTLDSSRKYRIVPCLQIALEQNIITPTQITDVLKIIENHFSIMMKEIWNFVRGVDEVGRIILLPRKEFYEKFGNVKDHSELELIILKIKSSLFSDDLISKKYITEQWQTIELFWDYFDGELNSIKIQNNSKWKRDIYKYIHSDTPIVEKINRLIDIKAEIEYTQLSGDKGLQKKNDLLKIGIEHLKLKHKYTQNTKDEKENSNIVTKSNPHPRIFKLGAHFELFEHLKESVSHEHADYSFIFRAMQKDEFIWDGIKESEFRGWLTETYGIGNDFDKLKLYDYCQTPSKVSNYGTSKLLYKL